MPGCLVDYLGASIIRANILSSNEYIRFEGQVWPVSKICNDGSIAHTNIGAEQLSGMALAAASRASRVVEEEQLEHTQPLPELGA